MTGYFAAGQGQYGSMMVPSHAVGIGGNENLVTTHGSYAPGEAVYDEYRSNAHPAITAIGWRLGRQV